MVAVSNRHPHSGRRIRPRAWTRLTARVRVRSPLIAAPQAIVRPRPRVFRRSCQEGISMSSSGRPIRDVGFQLPARRAVPARPGGLGAAGGLMLKGSIGPTLAIGLVLSAAMVRADEVGERARKGTADRDRSIVASTWFDKLY